MRNVPRRRSVTLFCCSVAAFAGALPAQQTAPGRVEAPPAIPYAQAADLVLAAPIIIDAVIRGAARITGAEAAGVAPRQARLYVTADVLALLRGSTPLPPRIGYVLDVPLDSRGKVPRLRKLRVLLFARPVAADAAQVQLVGPSAQRPWTPELDALTRTIAVEVLAATAPPVVTGVGTAFHVPGALPGESETQIFLPTADGRPVSLSILRRPGEPRRWSVALSEIVDQAAPPPQRDTLLWYRLACALPAALPESSTAALAVEDAAMAREDYAFVIASLGACGRGTPADAIPLTPR